MIFQLRVGGWFLDFKGQVVSESKNIDIMKLHNGDHCGQVRSSLREMLTNGHYWNTIVYCSNGALAHNRYLNK